VRRETAVAFDAFAKGNSGSALLIREVFAIAEQKEVLLHVRVEYPHEVRKREVEHPCITEEIRAKIQKKKKE